MSDDVGCGCTGIRNCALCEKQRTLSSDHLPSSHTCHWYCLSCQQIFVGSLDDHLIQFGEMDWCRIHNGLMSSMNVSGICVKQDFIDNEEEETLLNEINKQDWKISQSGRKKQVRSLYVNIFYDTLSH